MRTLINYFRSLFCKHEFVYEEKKYEIIQRGSYSFIEPRVVGNKIMVSRTCKKCGWHTSYKKF